MIRRLLLPAALLLLGNIAVGQTPKDSVDIPVAEQAGDQARAAGDLKAALTSYVAAMKDVPFGTEPDQRLREKAIAVARSMKPAPILPKEARRHSARAEEFFKRAKDRKGYELAIKEFEAALAIVPWWAPGYFNLGLLQEKAKDFAGAIRSFKLYLLAAPRAKDAAKVEKKIFRLEVAQELADARAGEWVTIPGGTFMMGSPLAAVPVHQVTVETFQITKTEITVDQFRACVKAGACKRPFDGVRRVAYCNYDEADRGNHPVNCLGWDKAKAFAEWVGGRFPTEAEWEYAARSGGKDKKYPWGDEKPSCERAVMRKGGKGCGRRTTWPVCSKPEGNTEQGLCDMAGNAVEYVQDWYHRTYDGAPTDGSAWESPKGDYRVIRGGAWNHRTKDLRSANRRACRAGYLEENGGFRVAR